MAKINIIREKLSVKKNAEVHEISVSKNHLIMMTNNRAIDAGWLLRIKDGDKIVDEINIYLRGQRGDRSVANTILRYLRTIPEGESVGYETLNKYKNILDFDSKKSLNTKNQEFAAAIRFSKHLTSCGIIPHAVFPRNFKRDKGNHKYNFIDAARYKIPFLMADHADDVRDACHTYALREDEAQALVYGRHCMSSLRRHAEKTVHQHIKDWEYVDSIIDSLRDDDISYYQNLDFRSVDKKSIELVVRILFAKYGRAIPSSDSWPDGISDWCRKTGGWRLSRISGAFFPQVKTLDAFLVITLTDSELMPDVDSVAFYAYLDCCKPSFDSRNTVVNLGKFRGSPLSATLSNSDSTVLALQALSTRIKKLLPYMPGGHEILSNELVSMMVHCTKSCGRPLKASLLNRSTLPYMVRRFIASAKVNDAMLAPLAKISGENFRSTHAYLSLLSGKSVDEIRVDMSHSHYSTTEGYIEGIEAQSIINRRQQKYQEYLISEAKSSVGKRTGSGYICSSDENEKGGCVNYNGCSNCSAKRIVLESPELVAEWMAWESKISESREELEYGNPDRWRIVWEPKLLEYQALLEMAKSRTLYLAKKIAGSIVLPCIS